MKDILALGEVVYKNFALALEKGLIEINSDFTKEDYLKRLEKEISLITANDLTEMFFIIFDVMSKAKEYGATTKEMFSFDWLIGYLIGLTTNNQIKKQTNLSKSLYMYVRFCCLENYHFIDFIVKDLGFYKPLETEEVYLLEKENVFIQLNIG